ncbi:ecdysteroid-regulated 16 kDa protein [Neocloeon triangulifer]|uniref:ecdysteroid-regulated 16 kDa protein n=1 Tax=Neocloeon triangulifer TaxID=2078957 RepID=UPI00286F06D5|nr:ecdysteroid-regulated 16 kDa protein [Neocloeon triangulifer]
MKRLLLLLAIVYVANATSVRSCRQGVKYLSDDVQITNCTAPPCKLKQKTKVGVSIKLRPEKDIPFLTTSVFGIILGLPLPFVGVDQTNACLYMFNPDGSKAGCPLKAGNEYVYKNEFEILEIYPKIKVEVLWALNEKPDQEPERGIHCFKVQSRITS